MNIVFPIICLNEDSFYELSLRFIAEIREPTRRVLFDSLHTTLKTKFDLSPIITMKIPEIIEFDIYYRE